MTDKYSTNDITVESLLTHIKTGAIAIPEIQRPFVWKTTQVRDLIDSIYRGYPTGYIIVSKDPSIKLKDGSMSLGKMIMIDGQQRVTALTTAIAGMEVTLQDFKKGRVKIAFNPLADTSKGEDMFKVQDASVLKSKRWIADIADVFNGDFYVHQFIKQYLAANEDAEENDLERKIMRLIGMRSYRLGMITLHENLTVDEVTDIFVRINQQGTKLNQSDFVMSKIAANTTYGGNTLRKAIDYFSHLALMPEWYSEMCKDNDFMASTFAQKMKWLQYDKEEIFDPDYGDILRVAFMYKFGRAKMKDLVELLNGRDFATRENREGIKEEAFSLLNAGVLDFMNEYTFSNFVLTIKSAGFVAKKLIYSSMSMDFAYTLYLLLNNDTTIEKANLKHYIAKWYVLATLTGRYSSSAETQMEQDLQKIKEVGFQTFFANVEAVRLSDTFWNEELIQLLDTSVISSPYFNVFIASQIFFGDNSLFSNGSKISDLITIIGDVHHIFPKKYLIRNGIVNRTKYNQIANFTYLDTMVNKAVGDDAPNEYFRKAYQQCEEGKAAYGNISDTDALNRNLEANCIPMAVVDMDFSNYETFLAERRGLMARKIKEYYYSL